MARTKSRSTRFSPLPVVKSNVAVIEIPGTAPAPDGQSSALARGLTRAFLVCSSLRLAIVLLSLFTLGLITATLLESAYSAGIAQDLIYRTWWFCLLLVLLAVNILCAALKKYPWKKHQTGFLITHSGLLVLVFGGLLTTVGGTDGSMTLTDTDGPGVQRMFGPNTSAAVLLPDEHTLEIWQLRKPMAGGFAEDRADELCDALASGKSSQDFISGKWQINLSPGQFTWRADAHTAADLPLGLLILKTIASPFPARSFALDTRTVLDVENYYPHTEAVPYSPAPSGQCGLPALKIELQSPMAGSLPGRWIYARPGGEYRLPSGNALVEMMVLPDLQLLPEFLSPPSAALMGKHGLLVVALGMDQFRIPVDRSNLGVATRLGATGRTLRLLQYIDNLDSDPHGGTQYPGIRFEVTGPAGPTEYHACSRVPHLLPELLKSSNRQPDLAAWFHHPDCHHGDSSLSSVLQLLQAPDGKLYYRHYGKEGLQGPGQEIDPADRTLTHACWNSMGFRFRIADYLPEAIPERRLVPHDIRPGVQRMDLVPALRCRLSRGEHGQEIWVRLGEVTPQRVYVAGDWYCLRYGRAARQMEFRVTLKRAQRVTDPGTERAASFSSDVVLTYEPRLGQTKAEEHHICMNQPLVHGQYKFYQADYKFLGFDPHDNPISVSGLTVAHDPGLWFKYSGSFLVVLGIVTMFWMKAYFFRA